jgi:ribosomal protein S18 acetylase RimI-like enzyme
MTAYREDWDIRPATLADVDALVTMRLRLQAHMAHVNPGLLPMSAQGRAALPERYREAMADATVHVLVVQAQGTEGLVGMAVGRLVGRADLIPSHMGRLGDVWVEPSYRRRGICRALMQQLVVFFEQCGVQSLVLDYVVGNAEAEHTWRHLGFRPVLTLANADLGAVKQRLGGRTV